MAVPEGKTRVQVTLDDEILDVLDFVASEAGITRSNLIENLVEVSIEDMGRVAVLGMPPRRSKRLAEAINGHPILEKFFAGPSKEVSRAKSKKRLGFKSVEGREE